MKRLSLICLFCLAYLYAVAQNIPQNPNKTDKKKRRQGAWTLTYNKDWAETKQKDSIAYYRVLAYLDDKPQGITTDYYLSGKKQWEARLTADRPKEIAEGKATWYHENGQTAIEVFYAQGVKVGKEVAYLPNGTISNIVHYNKQGQKHGKEFIFDEAGKPSNLTYYENDSIVPLQPIWNNAVASYEAQRYAEADTLFQDIYLMFKGRFGKDHENCPPALSYLWNSQNYIGKFDSAEENLEEMIRVRSLQKLPKDSLLRDWLYEALVFYKKIDKYPPIEKHLLRILEVQKELTGEESSTYWAYRRALGDYYRHEKRYREGQKILESDIAYLKQTFPNQPDKYKDDLASLAFLYENEQQYEKAERLYLEAFAIFEAQKDTTENHANALSHFTDLLQAQDKNPEAIPYAQKLIVLQEKRVGKMHTSYISALRNLLQSYRELQQFPQADSLLQEMMRLGSVLHKDKGYSWSSLYFDLAILRAEAGKLEEAKDAYQKAIYILDSDSLRQVPAYIQTYTERYMELWAYLGETYARNKEVINAEKAFLKATEYLKLLTNQEVFVVAQIYEKIGTAQARIDNYTEAEEMYKGAMKISQKVFGYSHHNYIQAVANLATLYSYSAKGQKAVEILEELLAKLQKAGKEDSPTYLQLLNSKAVAYTALEQDSAVTATYTQILERYKKIYTEDSPNYMNQLANLIKNQISFKHYDEAEKTLKELEKIAERNKIKTIDKFYYNTILVLKGFLANSKGDYLKAVEYGQEENAIGRFLGKPKTGLVSMAMNYFMNNQAKEAAIAYKKYVDYVIQDVRQVFPYLAEEQKVSFYKSEMQYHLDLYYYMALAEPLRLYFGEKDSTKIKANRIERNKIHYIKHPNVGEIFNLQLITKGILFEASQKMKQAILGSADKLLIQKFNEWQAKKQEMNKVFLEPDSKQKEARKAKINTELKDIEKTLAQKSSYFNQNNAKNYTWQDVQKKLKKGEALVEILAINAGQKINFAKYKTSDMYLAFIITPETKDVPLCVRIGEGDSLERKYARNYQNCIKGKKQDKYSYNIYWQKLADTLKGVSKIYFAPDGIYHKVNINTLQNPATGKFVIEEKDVQFISQARDFVQQTNLPTNLPTEIKLFGAPNYNNLPDTLSAPDVERTNIADKSLLNGIKQDTTQRFFAGGDIAELPGTETEVHNIAKIFEANKLTAQKFLGDEASEGKLKAQKNPTILHIATHGFFVSEKTMQQAKEESATQRSVFASFNERDLENPLRRAGILLAYCKEAFKPKDKKNLPEDGILTAEEVQNLTLDKTALVVLSACETGLGEVKNGEGVYGLQRAFQTAGAKSVLMSLWTVSDQATQELMTAFYEQWFKLKDKRLAFREAQLSLKARYPEPYYWGAFVLVGE